MTHTHAQTNEHPQKKKKKKKKLVSYKEDGRGGGGTTLSPRTIALTQKRNE